MTAAPADLPGHPVPALGPVPAGPGPDPARGVAPSVGADGVDGVVVPAHQPQLEVPVLYIGGTGRSGSTLLDRVLGQVPGCWSVGETVHVWRNLATGVRCGCGRVVRDCPFWSRVGERAFGGWAALDLDEVLGLQSRVGRTRHIPLVASGLGGRAFRRDLGRYRELLSALYRGLAAESGSRLLVDSGKHPSHAYLLLGVRGLDVRVVQLVRDSRGVAYSWTKVKRKSGHDDAELMNRLAPWKSALQWTVDNLATAGVSLLRRPRRFLRYEALVADPLAELRGLLAFAGLQPADEDLRFVSDDSVELGSEGHTVAGNPMRFDTGLVRLRPDEEWRSRLSRRDQLVVTALTWPLLKIYGYRP